MTAQHNFNDLFERTVTLPDPDARDRLSRLVGIDEKIRRLANVLSVLVNPVGLRKWVDSHHPAAENLLDIIQRRPPLVVLCGDVGSGKTELAETIGDQVARQEQIDITVLPLSLSSRGQGRVGEMTTLITTAFDHASAQAAKLKANSGKARGGVILLIDEADALAQSRESAQMHHEDRAGVNALIRGIDRLAAGKLPAAVIMCTNRLNALDPAIRRRAAEILTFDRPNEEQRQEILSRSLKDAGLDMRAIKKLVDATGPSGERHGYTYSDLTQRLIPSIVLDAYPTGPIKPERAWQIALATLPTPPFREA